MAIEENATIAAGGLIFDDSEPPRVLVIHRQRYDDWSFPKGKAKRGESLREVALREVEEETGLKCRIEREAGVLRYPVRPGAGPKSMKVVTYFIMKPVSGEPRADGEEVDRLEWISIEEAANRLSYAHDRDLLARILQETRD